MANEKMIMLPHMKQKLHFLMTDLDARRVGAHPGTEAGFANAIGVARGTLRGWLGKDGTTRNAIPSYTNDNIAGRFKFAPTWEPWREGTIEVLKEAFKRHADDLLKKTLVKDQTRRAESAAVAWNPPTTRAQVLKRLEALKLEELTGTPVGTGHIALAQHSVTFEKTAAADAPHAPSENSVAALKPVAGPIKTKLKLGERQFASVAFSGLTRNDASFPWPLGLDFDLGALDDGLHIRLCSIECTFTGQATTCEVGQRKRLPGAPQLDVSPETTTRKARLKLTPHGSGDKHAGWTVEVSKGPVGSFTGSALVEVMSAGPGDTVEVMLILPLKGIADGIEE